MPTVGARVPSDDAPLIEIGHAEIRGQSPLQAPRAKEVVLGSGAPDGRDLLAVDPDHLVALSKPHRAPCANGKHGSHIMPLPLRIEHQIGAPALQLWLPIR